jgi:hypothetical protein
MKPVKSVKLHTEKNEQSLTRYSIEKFINIDLSKDFPTKSGRMK